MSADDVLARWRGDPSAHVVYEHRSAEAPPILVIECENGTDYLLRHQLFGTYLVTQAGSQVAAAPGTLPAWRWQRFLIGQVLPLAAVLQGREVFHSSAIEIDGCGVLFMGPSGSGKTTLALGLTMAGAGAGAGFLADDVVATSRCGEMVVAHPGPPIASLDTHALASMEAIWARQVGTVVGGEEGESRLVVRGSDSTVPVRLVYLLQPRGGATTPSISALDAPDPRRLLGSTFNAYVDAPERLLGQLGTVAALSRSASFFALTANDTPIAALAAEVNRHAESALERSC